MVRTGPRRASSFHEQRPDLRRARTIGLSAHRHAHEPHALQWTQELMLVSGAPRSAHLPLPRMSPWLRIALVLWLQVHLLSPELGRLPMLFVHFADHLQHEQGLTFAGYLVKHYADDGHEESDHSEHGSLPFHHHHHGMVADQCTAKIITSEPLAMVSFPLSMADRDQALPGPMSPMRGHVGALLRPPRPVA